MKRVLQIVAAISFSFLALSVPVSAQQQCYIVGQTGPDSNNQCINTENLSCQVLNNTIISINNNSVQVATSGEGENSNNTSTQYVVTGPATNTNTSAVNGTITNGSCVTPKPETPGQGSGTTELPVAPAASVAPVTTLPKTSATPVLAYGLIAVMAVAAIALVSKVSVAVLSKINN